MMMMAYHRLSVQVPDGLEYAVWKGQNNSCSDDNTGGKLLRKMTECTEENSNQCTYKSTWPSDPLSFQFKLAPGSYAKCGDKTYYATTSEHGGRCSVYSDSN